MSPDIPRRRPSVEGVVARVDGAIGGGRDPDTIATDFPGVDRMLGGGLRRRDLVVLGGDVGVGKSSFALAVAVRVAAQGLPAVYFSGEMDEERVFERALAIEGRIRVTDLRRGSLSDEARAAIGAVAVRLRDQPLAVVPLRGDALDEVLERIAERRAALTVVDYLQLLPPSAGTHTAEEQAAAAVRRLKETALATETALLLVSQLPRHNPKRRDPRPHLDDFGATGAVKYHADVVLGLYREEMYQAWRGMEGATELLVSKNRHGATGFVDLFFYKDWMRFEDMLDPDR